MIKRILLGLDSSKYSQSAIDYAVDIAKRNNAKITGLSIVDVEGIEDSEAGAGIGSSYYAAHATEVIENRQEKEALKLLENLKTICVENNIQINTLIEKSIPLNALIEDLKFNDILVLAKSADFTYEKRTNNIDIIYKLLKKCIKPVLVTADEFKPIKKVMIALGKGISSYKAVQMFLLLNLWKDSEVVVFHSYREEKNQAIKFIGDYIQDYGYKVELIQTKGDAKENILEYSDIVKADCIILGGDDKTDFLSSIFGSTFKHIIERTDKNLLIYR